MPSPELAVDLRGDFTGRMPLQTTPTPEGRSTFTLTAGVIDDDVEAMFGRGYCHWLAGAIHALTGWDLVTVDTRARRGEWQPAHTAVRTPDGRLLDIFGEHTKDALFANYLKGEVYEARMRTVKVENFPGDVLTDIDELRGNPHWWARMFTGPYQGVLLHYARLLLRNHGHSEHIRPAGIPGRATDRDRRATSVATPRPSSTSTHERETAMSAMQDVINRLIAMSGRVPVAALQEAAATEMPPGAVHADAELLTLLGELQDVMGDGGFAYASELYETFSLARAKLEQAAQSHRQMQMWLGDARDAAARAQQYLVSAISHHKA
ncbi:hypothetical protein ACWEOG_19385 [Amycolatopsis japonica]